MTAALINKKLIGINETLSKYYEKISTTRMETISNDEIKEMLNNCDLFLFDLYLYEFLFISNTQTESYKNTLQDVYTIKFHLNRYVQ